MKLWKFCIPPDQEVPVAAEGFSYTNCLAVAVAETAEEARALIKAHPTFSDDRADQQPDEHGGKPPSANAWVDHVTPQEIDIATAGVIATARIGW